MVLDRYVAPSLEQAGYTLFLLFVFRDDFQQERLGKRERGERAVADGFQSACCLDMEKFPRYRSLCLKRMKGRGFVVGCFVCFQEKALEGGRVERARAQAQDLGLRAEWFKGERASRGEIFVVRIEG
jgi:hypothetical protein